MRLAVLTSHPIQYHAPLFRELARRADLHVFYAHRATPDQQGEAGFGRPFDWDIDLTSGYAHSFLVNVAATPSVDHFAGCDTPEIGQKIETGNFDALVIFGWHLKTYLQGLFAAKRRRVPVMVRGDSQLVTPRSMLKRAGKAIAYPGLLRAFDAALYVGQRSRAYYRHYGYPSERLFSSPHCVDTQWFAERSTAAARDGLRSRLGISPERRIALFAGKLLPRKRPLDVIAAVSRLKSAGIEVDVLIAGSGPLESEIDRAARGGGVACHMLGFCNQSQMPAAYAAADVLVLPSDSRETWGLVANEALACGRPIVVSDAVGCAPDLAGDGSAGRVFPVGDPVALADALASLLDRPPASAAIASINRANSVDAAVDGIVRAANDALERKVH